MIYFTNLSYFHPHPSVSISTIPLQRRNLSQPLPPRRSSIWTAVFGCASAATATAVATSGGSGSAAEGPAFVAGNGLRQGA